MRQLVGSISTSRDCLVGYDASFTRTRSWVQLPVSVASVELLLHSSSTTEEYFRYIARSTIVIISTCPIIVPDMRSHTLEDRWRMD